MFPIQCSWRHRSSVAILHPLYLDNIRGMMKLGYYLSFNFERVWMSRPCQAWKGGGLGALVDVRAERSSNSQARNLADTPNTACNNGRETSCFSPCWQLPQLFSMHRLHLLVVNRFAAQRQERDFSLTVAVIHKNDDGRRTNPSNFSTTYDPLVSLP